MAVLGSPVHLSTLVALRRRLASTCPLRPVLSNRLLTCLVSNFVLDTSDKGAYLPWYLWVRAQRCDCNCH